jgi:hypothetical protein
MARIRTILVFAVVFCICDSQANGECTSRAPSGTCTPGFSVPPTDEFDPRQGCPAVYSSPVGIIIKTSVWSVSWPDGTSTTFRSSAGGQCLYTQNGCCLSVKYEYCYPQHWCPQVGHGFIQQLVVAAGVNHHYDDCGRIFCRAYEVFDGCNTGASDTRVSRRNCSIGGVGCDNGSGTGGEWSQVILYRPARQAAPS